MNALVLALLLRWVPSEWALRRVAPMRVGIPILVAAVPAAAYLLLVAPRLPDPLTVGTPGRALVLAVVASGWLLIHGLLATALGLPGTAALRSRFRRAAPAGLGLAALLALPGAARAQSTVQPALLPEHSWTVDVLEWLEARGVLPVGAASVGPLPARRAAILLGRAASDDPSGIVQASLERLRIERGSGRPVADWIALGLGAGVVDPPVELQGTLDVEVARPGSTPFAFLSVTAGDELRLARGGVGFHGESAWVLAGRERIQLGGERSGALVLNANVALDGVTVGTSAPLELPLLGEVTLVGGLGPMRGYESVEDPWWAMMRVAANPVRWLQIGLSRAALVGGHFEGGAVAWDPKVYGPDEGSPSATDFLKMAASVTTQYDNQLAALDVRASAAPAGLPLLMYAELSWEDADCSWGDPELVAGVLTAPASPLPIALRYEYAAFGSVARWCAWCDTLSAFWYQHTRFQSGWRVGDDLIGYPLGGYGQQHELGAATWSRDLRLEGSIRRAWIRRDRWNLLEDARPGSASRWELSGRWRARPRIQLEASWLREEGSGWTWRCAALELRGFL